MRDLSATKLEATQKKSMIDALWKIVLTSGATTHTYDKTRVLDIKHTEEAFSHKATVLLNNSDGVLTDLALEGYQGVISYGMITKAGEEYSAQAPLTVIAQELDASPGALTCTLELIGIPNMLAEDRASVSYKPTSSDTKTVKDIINDMFDGTMTAYNHCQTYTVDWDSEDDLIDVYTPKDGFRIYKGSSRLAALRQLIDYTKCVAIFDADGHITIKEPTITGDTYDYEYSLAATYHNFFAKAYRKRLVIPNKIQVDTDPDADTPYTGSAVDAASYAALGRYITQFETAHLDDDDQGDDIAEAMLSKYQLNAEAGAATVPINVGAEMYDYVKVYAFNAEDEARIGNIGKIVINVDTRGKTPKWEMRFSFGGWLSVRQRINELETYPSGIGSAGQYFSRLSAKDAYIENLQADNILLYTLDEISEGDTYKRVLATHITAGQIVIDEHISYTSGYDPTDKLDKTDDSLDDVPDGTTYTRLLATQISAGKISLTDTAVFQSGYDPTDKLDKTDDSLDDVPEGTTYQRVLATQISAGKISLTSTGFLINEDHITAEAAAVEIDGSAGIALIDTDIDFYDDEETWVGNVGLLVSNLEVRLRSREGYFLNLESAGDIELDPGAHDIYSTDDTDDVGTATNPFDDMNAYDFIDRDASPRKVENAINKIKAMGTHIHQRPRKGVGIVEFEAWNRDTFPEEILRPIIDRDNEKAEKHYQHALRKTKAQPIELERFRAKLARLEVIGEKELARQGRLKTLIRLRKTVHALEQEPPMPLPVKKEPKVGTSLVAMQGLLLSAIREVNERLEILEAK